MIEGIDFTEHWRQELLPLLQAGTVNRLVVNSIGEAGRLLAVRSLAQGDAGAVLRGLVGPIPVRYCDKASSGAAARP
jgi:hypothetical protein